MKKFLLIFLILLIGTTLAFSDNVDPVNWGGIKAGYGNETAGAGVALESRADSLGFTLGMGSFYGELGFNVGLKGYFQDERGSLWLSGEYGVLGYEWAWDSWSGEDEDSTGLIYGPYTMLGYTWVSEDGFYFDSGFGIGVGESKALGESTEFYTIQGSIGYVK